ncbi:MAG: iron ABC transporter permease [Halieaceae bacterium]|nr:iron ABC transporter permease [Halieaceae bacterium]
MATRSLTPSRLLTLLSVLLAASFLVALSHGAVPVSMHDTLLVLLPWTTSESAQASMIVGELRLPRAILAALVGANLAVCGAIAQGLFRNPLADPSLIGVSAGASLGASLVIVVGAGAGTLSGITLVSGGAFIGSLCAVWFVHALATRDSVTSVATMLLAGIAVTALAGAISTLLEYYSSDELLRRISLWRMGALDGANELRVSIALLVTLIVLLPLPWFTRSLDALLLGESEARYLGINVQATKTALIVLVAIGVGTSVALAGTIAFVGLVVPHIIRLLVGPGHRTLLPAAALAGATLMLAADTASRLLIAPAELPVGIVTALIGVPFFVYLLRYRSDLGSF